MSEGTGWVSVADMTTFETLERLSDDIWRVVSDWRGLARDTIGVQLVRAVDSVGANLVEGDSRYTYKDKLHFCYIARASLAEAQYWIKRASVRGVITEESVSSMLQTCSFVLHWINALISQRRQWLSQVREDEVVYGEAARS